MAAKQRSTAKSRDGPTQWSTGQPKYRNRQLLPRRPKPFSITRPERRQMLTERNDRLHRLHDAIVGTGRAFKGKLTHNPQDASSQDPANLSDISNLSEAGRAAIYWTSGSAQLGYMGVGVVWQEKALGSGRWQEAEYPIGYNTGTISDAQAFGVAVALGLAVDKVKEGKSLKVVRIFTHSPGMISSLHKQKYTSLGPMLGDRFALLDLYERSDWLVKHGVEVELVWLKNKGHVKSKAVRLADEAADRAAHANTELSGVIKTAIHGANVTELLKTIDDVPQIYRASGQDWIDEWLWRQNKSLYDFPTKNQAKREKLAHGVQDLADEELDHSDMDAQADDEPLNHNMAAHPILKHEQDESDEDDWVGGVLLDALENATHNFPETLKSNTSMLSYVNQEDGCTPYKNDYHNKQAGIAYASDDEDEDGGVLIKREEE